MAFGQRQNAPTSFAGAMSDAVDGWPYVLSAMQGLIRQTEEAGFSPYVAKVLVLSQFGMPVPRLERADLEGEQ